MRMMMKRMMRMSIRRKKMRMMRKQRMMIWPPALSFHTDCERRP